MSVVKQQDTCLGFLPERAERRQRHGEWAALRARLLKETADMTQTQRIDFLRGVRVGLAESARLFAPQEMER